MTKLTLTITCQKYSQIRCIQCQNLDHSLSSMITLLKYIVNTFIDQISIQDSIQKNLLIKTNIIFKSDTTPARSVCSAYARVGTTP